MTDAQADATYMAALRERLAAVMPADMPFRLTDEGRGTGALVMRVTVDCGPGFAPLEVLVRVDGGDVDSVARSVADFAIQTTPRPR